MNERFKWYEGDIEILNEEAAKAFNPNQPRARDGKWTGTGGGGATEGPDSESLKQHVQMIADFQSQQGQVWAHDFVAKHGKAYKFNEASLEGGIAQQCYKNAALEAMSNPDVTYVEGFVSVYGVPIAHAWVVTEDGVVRDVTIAGSKKDKGMIRGYFGVPIKTGFLSRTLLKSKVYGILVGSDNPKTVKLVIEADPKDVVA